MPSLIKVICGNNGRVYVTLLQYNTVYAISADLGTLVWEVKVGPLGETSSTVLIDSSGSITSSFVSYATMKDMFFES